MSIHSRLTDKDRTHSSYPFHRSCRHPWSRLCSRSWIYCDQYCDDVWRAGTKRLAWRNLRTRRRGTHNMGCRISCSWNCGRYTIQTILAGPSVGTRKQQLVGLLGSHALLSGWFRLNYAVNKPRIISILRGCGPSKEGERFPSSRSSGKRH